MKTMQDLGFLKLTIRNLVVCERGKLARLSVQDIHEEFLEHRNPPDLMLHRQHGKIRWP